MLGSCQTHSTLSYTSSLKVPRSAKHLLGLPKMPPIPDFQVNKLFIFQNCFTITSLATELSIPSFEKEYSLGGHIILSLKLYCKYNNQTTP